MTKDLAAELASGDDEISDEASGPLDFRGADFGNGLTSCPQAGRTTTPSPLQDLTPDTLANIAKESFVFFPRHVEPAMYDDILAALLSTGEMRMYHYLCPNGIREVVFQNDLST